MAIMAMATTATVMAMRDREILEPRRTAKPDVQVLQ